jgi:hypothetical protein
MVSHGEVFTFGGLYFVKDTFRERGYGLKTIQAVDDIVNARNLHMYVIPTSVDFLSKNFEFMPRWVIRHYQLVASVVHEKFSSCQPPPSCAKILPVSQVNFTELTAYSVDMMGSSQVCKSMLAAMLVHAQESSWVAVGSKGEIVGYLIMSESSYFPESGYLIGPLFADSAFIARILFRTAAEFAAKDRKNPKFLSLDVSMHNQECIDMMECELGAKRILESVFITRGNCIPCRNHGMIFSLASTAVL